MRKLLLSIVAASMTLAACNAQSGYKVTGTVEGMPDGKAIIATVNGSSLDTLAKADVKNGSFEFTGNVSEPTGAYIMVIGQRSYSIHVRKCKYYSQCWTGRINCYW